MRNDDLLLALSGMDPCTDEEHERIQELGRGASGGPAPVMNEGERSGDDLLGSPELLTPAPPEKHQGLK